MTLFHNRPWYQFSLRTMFVAVLVVSIPLAWVGYQLNWLRQRQAWRKEHPNSFGWESDHVPPKPAPGWLGLFGEEGVAFLVFDDEHQRLPVTQLFPEAIAIKKYARP